jgi:hypothetical protein
VSRSRRVEIVVRCRLVLSAAVVTACLGWAVPASADTDAEATVALEVAVEGSVRAESRAGATSCTGPCTLRVAPGFVRLSTPELSSEVYVERASKVVVTRGAPAVKTAGVVALVAGLVVVVAAVAVPLLVCRTGEVRYDAMGRPQTDPNPCADLGDGVKVAWISGAGVGLTAAIVGGVLVATAGPSLRVTDAPVARKAPPPRLVPWTSTSAGGALGLSFAVTF